MRKGVVNFPKLIWVTILLVSRLNKYIVELGICSRRKADDLIQLGKVFINGKKAELGYQLKTNDLVKINNIEYSYKEANKERTYIALYKPKGYLTSFEKHSDSKTLDNLFKNKEQLHYAGRLDKDSSGLLILTNDGELSYKLTHPKFESEKEYIVECQKEITNTFVKSLSKGVEIDLEDDQSVITNPCFVEKLAKNSFRIILKQGYKRQIRLMVRALGNRVIELKRIRVANIALKEYKNFIQAAKTYTNMIILDDLEAGKFCVIEKPQI